METHVVSYIEKRTAQKIKIEEEARERQRKRDQASEAQEGKEEKITKRERTVTFN